MTNHERFDELLPIYALGALDGDELKEIEEHLKAGCSVCEEILKDTERVLSLIPYSLPSTPPSPRVKERLFEKIRATKKVEEKSYAPTLWQKLQPIWFRLGGAVALALLILLFISNLSLRDRLSKQQIEMSNLKEQVARQSEIVGFLQNPNVVTINLVGLKPDSKARGRVLWDTRYNKALFYGLNLPPIPSGKIYQLWVIADNTPTSMGIFNVDEKGNNLIQLENIPHPGRVQKFAVTLEPEGGVPQPTGEMYLIGAS